MIAMDKKINIPNMIATKVAANDLRDIGHQVKSNQRENVDISIIISLLYRCMLDDLSHNHCPHLSFLEAFNGRY